MICENLHASRRFTNPKSEIRNKFKAPIGKAQNQIAVVGNRRGQLGWVLLGWSSFEFLHFRKFDFVSDFEFEFRVSDFLLAPA